MWLQSPDVYTVSDNPTFFKWIHLLILWDDYYTFSLSLSLQNSYPLVDVLVLNFSEKLNEIRYFLQYSL